MRGKWEITLWAEAEDAGTTAFEGDVVIARVRGAQLAADFERATGRPTSFQLQPAGVEYEVLPRGWGVDEERGELEPREPATVVRDPLPRVGVRTFKDGGVRVVLERGALSVPAVLEGVGRVVKKHLGSAKSVEYEAVVACQAELEDLLARFAARRFIRARIETPAAPPWREWVPGAA